MIGNLDLEFRGRILFLVPGESGGRRGATLPYTIREI